MDSTTVYIWKGETKHHQPDNHQLLLDSKLNLQKDHQPEAVDSKLNLPE
jgi:hypothetical protein